MEAAVETAVARPEAADADEFGVIADQMPPRRKTPDRRSVPSVLARDGEQLLVEAHLFEGSPDRGCLASGLEYVGNLPSFVTAVAAKGHVHAAPDNRFLSPIEHRPQIAAGVVHPTRSKEVGLHEPLAPSSASHAGGHLQGEIVIELGTAPAFHRCCNFRCAVSERFRGVEHVVEVQA